MLKQILKSLNSGLESVKRLYKLWNLIICCLAECKKINTTLISVRWIWSYSQQFSSSKHKNWQKNNQPGFAKTAELTGDVQQHVHSLKQHICLYNLYSGNVCPVLCKTSQTTTSVFFFFLFFFKEPANKILNRSVILSNVHQSQDEEWRREAWRENENANVD